MSFTSYSQIEYKGIVKDSLNSPIEFANIIVLNDKEEVNGTITDENGRFTLEIEKKPKKMIINYLGFKEWYAKILYNENHNYGDIILYDSENSLNEIVLTSRKPLIQKKVDRLVFNVENSVAASGGNATDVLKITPRVRVRNDQVSMVGKSGMGVLINNKLIQLSGDDLINFLNTINADDIKSIEVITTPPAKYEAEGNSGLINIILKKGRADSLYSSLRTSYKQSTYPKGQIGASLAYNKDKLSLFSDLNYINGSIAPVKRNKIFYSEQLWNERSDRRDYSNIISYKLGSEYVVNEKVNISFQFLGNYSKPDIDEFNKTTLTNNITQVIDSTIVTNTSSGILKKFNSLNTNFTYNIDDIGKVLSFDADLFEYSNDNTRDINSNNFLNDDTLIGDSSFLALNSGNQLINNYSFNLDMEHPMGELSLNYGGRLSFSRTENEINFENFSTTNSVSIPSQEDNYSYKENTQSIYFSAQKEISNKFESKLGIRVENTSIVGNSISLNETNENSYTEIFPTAYILYSPNEKNNISLNYSRRIDRPTFSWLNPFKWYFSNFSFAEGNPTLTPSFTDNLELDFTHNDDWITSIYLSSLKDGFEYVTIVDETTNTQQLLAQNFIKATTIGIYEMFSFKIFNGLTSNIELDVYYSDAKSDILVTNQSLSGWNFEGFISNDLTIKEDKILFNLSYVYASDGVDNLDRNSSFSQLDTSVKFFFLDKKLQVTMTGTDILKTNQPEYTGFSNSFKTSFKNYYDTRSFRLSVIYNIGKKLKKEKGDNKNEEEIERI